VNDEQPGRASRCAFIRASHPDRGGDPAAFAAGQRALTSARARPFARGRDSAPATAGTAGDRTNALCWRAPAAADGEVRTRVMICECEMT
jgi:hypothetical protein